MKSTNKSISKKNNVKKLDKKNNADRDSKEELPTNKLWTQEQAAEYLEMHASTMQRWRAMSTGPDYIQMGGRKVRYRKEDLDRFIEEGKVVAAN